MFHSTSTSLGFITSREMLVRYIKNLSRQDIKKVLTPVKDGLLTENSVLHMNTTNFSVDHVVVPISVKEFLDEVGPVWKKWIHTAETTNEGEIDIRQLHMEQVIEDHQVLEYIKQMNKYQKRSMLNLVRDGILTDECFINLSDHQGPERVQIPMTRVVDTLIEAEKKENQESALKPLLIKIAFAKHYSSACFENCNRADLDVRTLSAARFTMPIWYTVLFLLMTFGTFLSQIWSQATNYEKLQNTLNLTVPTILLIFSSLAIGILIYLTIYIIGFLVCCETNLSKEGLLKGDLRYGCLYVHFCELNRIQARIYVTKSIQFGLLWYTMILSVYAHENNLNIYPALICVLTNGFGLMLFARIAQFLRTCRRTRHDTAIAAR